MFVRPRILTIFTTRRCTAQCEHCCVGSSPHATAAIPVSRIHGLIDEAARVPTIGRIAFTGGEAFLLGSDLDAVIAHALGFETRVITNGYWAVNERAARRRVRALREAGLDEIMLSTGTFHQRFVPVERIVHAARATTSAGMPTRIAIETCDQQRFDATVLREQLGDALAARTLALSEDPWITDAGGRGSQALTHERLRAAGGVRIAGGCAVIMTTLSVTPDQRLIACCGFPLEELPGLGIGSVADRALDDVLRDAPDDLLKMWLHVEGPAGIAEFVARYEPGYVLPGDPVSICDACIALQRDERAMQIAGRHAAEAAERIASMYVAAQSQTPDASRMTVPN